MDYIDRLKKERPDLFYGSKNYDPKAAAKAHEAAMLAKANGYEQGSAEYQKILKEHAGVELKSQGTAVELTPEERAFAKSQNLSDIVYARGKKTLAVRKRLGDYPEQ